MLTSLEIKNFRTFAHLRIKRLGQVNLIMGKNNVGKTTLLEALRLYGSQWPPQTAVNILYDRGEIGRAPDEGSLPLLQALFHGRGPVAGSTATIGPLKESGNDQVLRITAQLEEVQSIRNGARLEGPFASDVPFTLQFALPGREFQQHSNGIVGYTNRDERIRVDEAIQASSPPLLRGMGNPATAVETAGRWDRIALTEGEQHVIDVLQLISPIRGVTYVADPRRKYARAAKARVEGISEPIPLASLGDGVLRMFELAVALEWVAIGISSDAPSNNPPNVFPMLLIDEIETGIHHTLHADMWRFVLRAVHDHGVQVFATTHSWDCVKGFAAAVHDVPECDALAIRLETVEGKERTGAVIFDREELPIVVRESIEVR